MSSSSTSPAYPTSTPSALPTATSKIVKVSIACVILIVIISGLVLGFRIAYIIRGRRESKRRQLVHGFIQADDQALQSGLPNGYFLGQGSKKSWGGRKVKNAHKIEEWEGEAA